MHVTSTLSNDTTKEDVACVRFLDILPVQNRVALKTQLIGVLALKVERCHKCKVNQVIAGPVQKDGKPELAIDNVWSNVLNLKSRV